MDALRKLYVFGDAEQRAGAEHAIDDIWAGRNGCVRSDDPPHRHLDGPARHHAWPTHIASDSSIGTDAGRHGRILESRKPISRSRYGGGAPPEEQSNIVALRVLAQTEYKGPDLCLLSATGRGRAIHLEHERPWHFSRR
jgi:hypothetical protein